MRLSSIAALALSGSALAASQQECFAQHSRDLAQFSDCSNPTNLEFCLSQITGSDISDVEACYSNAGCSAAQAASEAKYALQRCDEFAKMGDLRKRYRGVFEGAEKTVAARNPIAAPAPTHWARDGTLQCLATSTVKTSSCDIQTDKGVLKTLTCVPTEVAQSACAPGLMCSMDSQGTTVCMKKQDSLGVAGIIIAIVFGAFIVIGITFLTFACCRERRHQKQLEARAEATALARAQTKKARAAEARAPLMRQEGGDPFTDRAQS
ncbi:uncharacterized protein TrAFT101_002141 [Trichoderma asperellum]|uniref:Extracellular membrane protein CFEM domain-containing protein n=1 Tax=Trichoderma asperellum (strain ATCC 204424 / CBS 433.97 / NBRC 101777) TaxID=1042311 RepID=A0A2T3ZFK2_TRIA4|nr:hypothetical protein M441DRAFT_56581 [Trichoderma asperellum CBS 433.97]PTB43582.1 hypothetical protein M441DRAFT_56581 [Trichoderma asperellum CBS 433.97]UKZ86305.1 hypothetical protein TrAFT101_002141 [Trichoderma asperellum]